MDVPYDPACPLLIDSDEESIEDEILGKKSQQKLVSRIDFGLDMQLKAYSKPKEKTDTKFVPAFEDDNEELLTYCLRESGFLSDDDGDATEDINKDKNAEEISKNEEKKQGVDDKKYKKKKKKDKKKESSTYRKEKTARELSSDNDVSIDKKDNSKKLDSKKSHKGGNKKVEKSFEVTKEKKKSRKFSSSVNESENSFKAGSNGDDEIDMLVVKELEEDLAGFPLSKTVDGGLENKEKTPRSSRSESKDGKNIKESSNNRHENESRQNDEKHKSKEKAKKGKRKRSKSSHKRSQSPDAEPENKKKRKNRHMEKPKEISSIKKDEKRKDEHLKHKKKHKHHSDDDDHERKERKHKKKEKDNSKKIEESQPRSKEKDDTHRKSSSSSHTPHKRHHSDRSHSEWSKQKEVDLKMKSKSEHNKKERRQNDHKREKHHNEKSEKKSNNKREGQDNKKEHTRHKGTVPQTFDSKGSKEKFNFDIEDGGKKVIEKARVDEEVDITKESENIKLQKEEEVKDELDGSDTDSEFERLSDIEREVEKEDSAPEDSAFDKDFEDQKSSIGNDKDSVTKSQDFVEQNVNKESSDSEQAKEQNEMSKEKSADIAEVKVNEKDAINNFSENDVIEKSSKTVNDGKSEQEVSESAVSKQEAVKLTQEKRPFKLFSKEETKKLKQELLVKGGAIDHDKMIDEDVEEDVTKKMECENENEEKFEKVETEEPPKSEQVKVDEKQAGKDQEEVGDDGKAAKSLQKSKDDLFDDIFAQEDDPENRENDGLAKMLGKDEETSPKRSSFKRQIPLQDKKDVVPNKEKGEARSARKTLKLKLEDGKSDGKKVESPKDKKERSLGEMVIPGLEPISIPGLELSSNKEKVLGKEEVKKSPSKIPLLFDDEASAQKLGIPKTPEFSPPKEKTVKRKQPYTPPEEFSGIGNEAEINQTDRYYHLEADDSPYNPEDLTLMDIGLSPVDAKNLQQDALKGAVEMRLKEPFSGYENPTWQKIIEAKSRHEVKRQSRKGHEKHNSKGFAKPQSSKQQKMVDMLVRQSRVEQECKEVLKLYYKSKEITKEEYKSILRKAVPQVTMSNSPIIPEKIRSLMKKFVCKSKGQRLMAGSEKKEKSKSKTRSSSSQSFSHSLTFPGEKRFRYLNPDLPMPPL